MFRIYIFQLQAAVRGCRPVNYHPVFTLKTIAWKPGNSFYAVEKYINLTEFWNVNVLPDNTIIQTNNIFILALLYLFECLNVWGQDSNALQLLETSVGNVISFTIKPDYVRRYIFVT